MGADIWRQRGTVKDHNNHHAAWTNIGTLGTEGRDGETPQADVPESWAFLLADDVLLRAAPATAVEWL
jgi:hypothetical protein